MRNRPEGDGPELTTTDEIEEAPAPRPESRRSRLAGPLVVVICALGALAAGAGWALSSPVGSSPDDDYHMVSIWCAGDGSPQCVPKGENEEGLNVVTVPAYLVSAACYAGNSAISGECQEGLATQPEVDSDRINTSAYPGGFYRVMHVFAGDDVPASVVTMRLVNVLLAVLLFTGLALAGTRGTRRLQVYTLTTMLVPVGWFTIASINPSGWAVTGVTAFGFGLHSAFVVRSRKRLAVNVGLTAIAAAVAMSARGDAAIYVVIVAFALCVLHWRTLLRRRLLLLLPAAATVASAAVALTASQVAGIATAPAETTRSGAEVAVNYVMSFPILLGGLFGYGWGLGWLDTYMPAITVVPVIAVVGFLALRGLARPNVGKVLAALVIAGVLVAIPFMTLYRARLIVGEGVQPRYLLPLAPALLLVLLTGRRAQAALRITRAQSVVIWVLLSAAHCGALYINMWRYVTGTDDPTLAADVEWWWWSGGLGPIATWVLASIGFCCFAATVVLVSRSRAAATPAGATRPAVGAS